MGFTEASLVWGQSSWEFPRGCRFDNVSGSNDFGEPNDFVPEDILASIKRNGTCLKVPLHSIKNGWKCLIPGCLGSLELHGVDMPVRRV